MIINEVEHEIWLYNRTFHCTLDITMAYIGGKWKAVILWYLRNGALRFGELRKRMPEITEKTLSLQLKQLVADGLVHREVFPDQVPIRVDYSLTPFGETLRPVLEAIADWGRARAAADGQIRQTVRCPNGQGNADAPADNASLVDATATVTGHPAEPTLG
jgi:DNA-binding HxlR family transcriptional regulator